MTHGRRHSNYVRQRRPRPRPTPNSTQDNSEVCIETLSTYPATQIHVVCDALVPYGHLTLLDNDGAYAQAARMVLQAAR